MAVLAALHARKQGAFTADTIRTVHLARQGYTLAEVEDALQSLVAFEWVKLIRHPAGATKAAQITGKGIIAHENGGDPA
jgi:hypothetical protein